jgi:signal transduction histidine kinase
LTLYRITQEALRNIARHAASRDAYVTLLGEDDAVTLEIEDSGRGFDVEAARADGGLGLVSMNERVRLIGGSIDVDSRPGRGTRIRVEAPIRAAAEQAENEPLEGVEYAQTASAAG